MKIIHIFFKIKFLIHLIKFKTLLLILGHFIRIWILKKHSPSAVMIALTYKCDSHCSHCAVTDYDQTLKEMELDEIKKIFEAYFISNKISLSFCWSAFPSH